MKTAIIVYHASGKTQRQRIRYKTTEELMQKTFEFETAFRYMPEIILVHDVAAGVCLHWNSTVAHNCFAKGRISTAYMFELLSKRLVNANKAS